MVMAQTLPSTAVFFVRSQVLDPMREVVGTLRITTEMRGCSIKSNMQCLCKIWGNLNNPVTPPPCNTCFSSRLPHMNSVRQGGSRVPTAKPVLEYPPLFCIFQLGLPHILLLELCHPVFIIVLVSDIYQALMVGPLVRLSNHQGEQG